MIIINEAGFRPRIKPENQSHTEGTKARRDSKLKFKIQAFLCGFVASCDNCFSVLKFDSNFKM
jgi:hypothetical protein